MVTGESCQWNGRFAGTSCEEEPKKEQTAESHGG